MPDKILRWGTRGKQGSRIRQGLKPDGISRYSLTTAKARRANLGYGFGNK
jgi:hypothetical protein